MKINHLTIASFMILLSSIANATDSNINSTKIGVSVDPASGNNLTTVTTHILKASSTSPNRMGIRIIDIYHQAMAFLFHEERFLADEIEEFRSAMIQDITHLSRLAEDAGYHLSEINFGVSLVPSVDLSFDVVRLLTIQEKESFTKRLDSEKIVGLERWILKKLLELTESPLLQRSNEYSFSGVQMSVDIIPEVELSFRKSSKE